MTEEGKAQPLPVPTRFPGLFLSKKEKVKVENEKLMVRMGLACKEVVKSSFHRDTKEVKAVLPGNSGKFWLRLELRDRLANEYMMQLMDKLKELLSEGARGEAVVTVVNSLALAATCLKYDTKAVAWKIGDLKPFASRSPDVKELLELLQTATSDDTPVDVGVAVMSACTLHTTEMFARMSEPLSEFPLANKEVACLGCFHYPMLVHFMRGGPKQRGEVLSHCAHKMLTIKQQCKRSLARGETTLLSLLHVMRSALGTGPAPVYVLELCSNVLEAFRMWPKPCGSEAEALWQLISEERRFPGSHILRVHEDNAITAQSDKGTKLYWVTDEGCKDAKARMQDMRLGTSSQNRGSAATEITRRLTELKTSNVQRPPGSQLTPSQKLMIMMNATHYQSPWCGGDIEIVKAMSREEVNRCFLGYTTLLDSLPSHRDFKEAEGKKKVGLAALKDDMLSSATKTPSNGAVCLPRSLAPPFDCPLPAVDHAWHPTAIEVSLPGTRKVSSPAKVDEKFLSFPFPDVQCKLQLEAILCESASVPKPVRVCIMVAGGDRLLHSFLCAYLSIWQSHPDWMAGIHMRFCLVPFGPGPHTVAGYIARHDSWYNRYVFLPATPRCPVLPFSSSDDLSAEDISYTPLPGRVMRNLFEGYAREARHRARFFIYQVQGWKAWKTLAGGGGGGQREQSPPPPDQCVPFICRVELGVGVEARARGKPMRDDSVAELNVCFKTMNLRGEEALVMSENPGHYSALALSNVPSTKDKLSAPAEPLRPWLELVATLQKPATAANAFSAHATQHVSCVEVGSKSDRIMFHVLVDGIVVGPFSHVKISKIAYPIHGVASATPFTFPIQTFFPVT